MPPGRRSLCPSPRSGRTWCLGGCGKAWGLRKSFAIWRASAGTHSIWSGRFISRCCTGFLLPAATVRRKRGRKCDVDDPWSRVLFVPGSLPEAGTRNPPGGKRSRSRVGRSHPGPGQPPASRGRPARQPLPAAGRNQGARFAGGSSRRGGPAAGSSGTYLRRGRGENVVPTISWHHLTY